MRRNAMTCTKKYSVQDPIYIDVGMSTRPRAQIEADLHVLRQAQEELKERRAIEKHDRTRWSVRPKLCSGNIEDFRASVRSMKICSAKARDRASLRRQQPSKTSSQESDFVEYD